MVALRHLSDVTYRPIRVLCSLNISLRPLTPECKMQLGQLYPLVVNFIVDNAV